MEIANANNCIVGEGPVWDPRTDTFWQVDLRGKCLYKTKDSVQEKILLPQKPGCLAISETGRVLVGLEDGVYWLDTMSLAHQPVKIKGDRFNDGKVGPDGAFYLGTVSKDGTGAFYRLFHGELTEVFDGCYCSNGLDWTADQRTMVYTDSVLYKLELFDFDSRSGDISNRRTFKEIPQEWGKPDGLTLDEKDDIWLALWDGHRAIHIDGKTAEIIESIEFPCPKVSCCAFGGADMKTFFVTTAAMEDVETYPRAGQTFAVKMSVSGRKIYYYEEDKNA